jgi:hypothetical protein
MTKHYAWSNFHGSDKDGKALAVKIGEEVTPSGLNVTQEEFDDHVANGSIRTTPWPVPEGSSLSPREHRLRKLAEATENADLDFDANDDANNETNAARAAAADKGGDK